MKITVTELTPKKVRFNLAGVDISLANGLRRIIISNVSVMAIDTVTFYENTSILNDEVLALRLGLIPLKTDLKTYNTVEECACKGKGCGRCTVTLTLDVRGPCTVYSGDLKSTDPEIRPVSDKIIIAKLTPEQAIKLEAKAELGTGKKHMKWQAGLASYEIKEDRSYNYMIETFEQLSLHELIDAAFNTLNQKIQELKTTLKEE